MNEDIRPKAKTGPKPVASNRTNDGTGTYKSSNQASIEYQREHYEAVKFSVPKGARAVIKAQADKFGLSVNDYLCRIVTSSISGGVTSDIYELLPKDSPERLRHDRIQSGKTT